jgi:hypothetical protein
MVREALLDNAAARKRPLLLILNDKLHSDALAVGREPNATTLHAEHSEAFACEAWERLKENERCVKHIFRSIAPISRLCRHERALLGGGQVA